MVLRAALFFLVIFSLFACSSGSRITDVDRQDFNSSTMSVIDGSYDAELWDYFAPFSREDYSDSTQYKVSLKVIDQRRILASLMYLDTVVVTEKKLKGVITNGYFSVRPKVVPIGIPFIFFSYYKGKIDLGLKTNNDLLLSVSETKLMNVLIIGAGNTTYHSKAYKKKQRIP